MTDLTAALAAVERAAAGDSNDDEIAALRTALDIAMSPAYVLVVRDPDIADQIFTDGPVEVVSIDLGANFLRTPDTERQAAEFASNLPMWLDSIPTTTPVYARALAVVGSTVSAFPEVAAIVKSYAAWREAGARGVWLALEIDITYELHDYVTTYRAVVADSVPPGDGEARDGWGYEFVHPATGVGHEYGDSWCDVRVIGASVPALVGETFQFGY